MWTASLKPRSSRTVLLSRAPWRSRSVVEVSKRLIVVVYVVFEWQKNDNFVTIIYKYNKFLLIVLTNDYPPEVILFNIPTKRKTNV